MKKIILGLLFSFFFLINVNSVLGMNFVGGNISLNNNKITECEYITKICGFLGFGCTNLKIKISFTKTGSYYSTQSISTRKDLWKENPLNEEMKKQVQNIIDYNINNNKFGYCPLKTNLFNLEENINVPNYPIIGFDFDMKKDNWTDSKWSAKALSAPLVPLNNYETGNEEKPITKKIDCSDFKDLTNPIWLWIRILAPILVIILGSIDFFKVIAAGDEKEIKQSVNTFIKRLIILGIIFMLPLIINLIFGLVKGDITACLDFYNGNTNLVEENDNNINLDEEQPIYDSSGNRIERE